MTRTCIGLLASLAVALLPTAASASCFFIYGPSNQLVYRSTTTPVDLSRPISESVRARFNGGHLVMIPDETGCPDLLAGGESKLFATLGFTSPGSGRTISAIDASPLFRNVGARRGTDSSGSATSTDTEGGATSQSPTRRSTRPPVAAPGR